MNAYEEVKVGDVVIYHDRDTAAHNAIVQHVSGSAAFVSLITAIGYFAQVPHNSVTNVNGNYWRLTTEEPYPYRAFIHRTEDGPIEKY